MEYPHIIPHHAILFTHHQSTPMYCVTRNTHDPAYSSGPIQQAIISNDAVYLAELDHFGFLYLEEMLLGADSCYSSGLYLSTRFTRQHCSAPINKLSLSPCRSRAFLTGKKKPGRSRAVPLFRGLIFLDAVLVQVEQGDDFFHVLYIFRQCCKCCHKPFLESLFFLATCTTTDHRFSQALQ